MSSVMTLKRYPSQGGMTFGKMGARPLVKDIPYDAEVEWLENTDKNYIDTGVCGDGDLDYEITFSSVTNISSYPYVFGSQIDDRQARYSLMWGLLAGGKASLYLNNGTDERTVYINPVPSVTTVKKIGLNYYIDGVLKGSFINNSYTTPPSIVLFACYKNDSVPTGQRMLGKIYNLKFSRNGVLVRDYVAVRVGSVGAMYDRRGIGGMNHDGSARTDGLYFNRGTGALIIGPDKN